MPVVHAYKIDWFRVLADINRAGYSLQSIASEIDVVASTLIGWKKGSVPRHHKGEALISMWCRVTKKDRKDLPQEKLSSRFIHKV
ncbi:MULTISPECIES: hypothetical protein [unclassified Pantoea]|uniref:hypothetical protein n=1 Tax=unclassified Pantoea TaxID=2630326 RepID=UPI001CD6BF7E|nr:MULTISPECIES: hypothetical protein [unclassified Pantoea]MCA1179806.1 hypothetical protein [Pantoea sp. alder69]MCA1253592.1 hypothetical protein [Pantoea sp. alder70]MCA1268292.1 hypothetical protein [Pantoea sp. alder81]